MKNFENIYYDKKDNIDENIVRQNNIVKLMYLIDRPEPTEFFFAVRQMAGMFLQKEMNSLKEDEWQKGPHWIKAEWTYPCFEHLTFAYKNQIFCILIEIINKNSNESFLPKNYKNNLIDNCVKNNLVPCLYKMVVNDPLNPTFNTITPISNGWNLYNAISNEPIIPEKMITKEKIEISEWELNDFAIQIVKDYIKDKLNYKILSYQNIVGVDPQIWFEDNTKTKNYVIVRNTIYPEKYAKIPENINEIEITAAGYQGYYASVVFKSKGIFDSKIYRGDVVNVDFSGIEKLDKI